MWFDSKIQYVITSAGSGSSSAQLWFDSKIQYVITSKLVYNPAACCGLIQKSNMSLPIMKVIKVITVVVWFKNPICHYECSQAMSTSMLWFDSKIQYVITPNSTDVKAVKLWFDSKIQYVITLKFLKSFFPSCGLIQKSNMSLLVDNLIKLHEVVVWFKNPICHYKKTTSISMSKLWFDSKIQYVITFEVEGKKLYELWFDSKIQYVITMSYLESNIE